MTEDDQFLCPECKRFTGWGTRCPDKLKNGRVKWSTATGHCNGTNGCGCGFSWPRKDDWKYFVSMRHYKSKKEFDEANSPETVTVTNVEFFGREVK